MVADMIPVQTMWGKVTDVSQDKKTCSVESLKSKGFQYYEVLLALDPQTAGITPVPEVGSKVLIGLIENLKNAAWVIHCEKVDHVQLHGDQFGGLVKIQDLKNQYDQRLTALKNAIKAGFTALSALDGSASLNAFNAASTSITGLQISSLENGKVKHG